MSVLDCEVHLRALWDLGPGFPWETRLERREVVAREPSLDHHCCPHQLLARACFSFRYSCLFQSNGSHFIASIGLHLHRSSETEGDTIHDECRYKVRRSRPLSAPQIRTHHRRLRTVLGRQGHCAQPTRTYMLHVGTRFDRPWSDMKNCGSVGGLAKGAVG